jgi:membrane protein required for colicin V production
MDGSPINPVDAVVLTVLLLSALIAFARGFVLEVLSIFAWIGAAVATLFAFPYARPYAQAYVGPGLLADAAAVLGVFLLVLVVLHVVSHQVSRGLRGGALGALDRSLGFLFGLARGGVLVCLAYLLGAWLVPPAEQPPWVRQARTMPAIEAGAAWLVGLAPRSATERAEAERRQRAESLQFLERMATPQPAPQAAPAQPRPATQGAAPAGPAAPGPGDPGYAPQERGLLDRLIESAR